MKRTIKIIAKILGGLLLIIVLVAGGIYLMTPKQPQATNEMKSEADLDTYLQSLVDNETPPALSVAVVKDNEIVYAKGFGDADARQQKTASADTVYHWWSVTKIYTAVSILQLYENDKLDLDAPVTDYLPNFAVTYPTDEHPPITIRHLLNHSSGLPDNVPDILNWVHGANDPALNQTALLNEKLPDYATLLFTPGTESRYTNIGYMVLGAIIEDVSGQSYEDYVMENVIRPLQMNHTGFLVSDAMAKDEAAGSHHTTHLFTPIILSNDQLADTLIREKDGLRYWFNRIYNDQTAPTGLIGSAADQAKFMQAYLNEGQFDGGQILSPETIKLMNQVSQIESGNPIEGRYLQGLGWKVYVDENGRNYLAHAGGGPGFAADMRIYPEENLGVFIAGNDTAIKTQEILDAASQIDW